MLMFISVVYVLASRVSTVEYNVEDLGRKAESLNAALSSITTINGLPVLNGTVALWAVFHIQISLMYPDYRTPST